MPEYPSPCDGAQTVAVSSRAPEWRVLLVYRHYASGFVYFPWMLSQAGLIVDAVATAGHPVRRAACLRRTFVAAAHDESFREIVAARLAAGNYAMLLLMDEPSRNLFYGGPVDRIVEPYLPVPRGNELVEALSDKERFYAWCERHGIPTPETHPIARMEEAIGLAHEWGYPVVLKGAVGMGGKAVRVCRDSAEVGAAYQELSAGGGRVLGQRFVSGAVGSCSFVAHRGRVSAWTASEKYVALANGLGPSAVRRLRNDPEIGRMIEKMAAAGAITGITGFDWMERRPGEFVAIDPHLGRCTPPAVISHFSGVNVGEAVRDLLEGNGRRQTPRGAGLVVAMFPQFIELIMQGEGWTLLKRANPLSRRVRYHLGPWVETRLSARLGASYVVAGLRVGLGRWRQKGRRAALARTAPVRPEEVAVAGSAKANSTGIA